MKVKGSVLLARVGFVKAHFGEEGWARVLDSFPARDRALFDGIGRAGWYPFESGRALDDAIVTVLADGDPNVFEDLGRASARENLTTIHKSFIELESPQGFMAKAPTIYGSYYDTGRRTYEETGPTSCVLTTYDADTFSTIDCLTIVGWYKEALGMCGAKDVRVVEEVCRARGDAFCRYLFSWS